MHARTLAAAQPRDETGESIPPLDWLKFVGTGVVVGYFAGFDEQDRFLVSVSASSKILAAASTICLRASDVGAQVVLALQEGDVNRPVILGRLQSSSRDPMTPLSVRTDGERLVLQAEREIELRCGDASIVLTRAGKVLIRGSYVLSRSKGANRIKGAYVDIN